MRTMRNNVSQQRGRFAAIFLATIWALLWSVAAYAQAGIVPTDPSLDRVNWAESRFGSTISGGTANFGDFPVSALIDGRGSDYGRYVSLAPGQSMTIDLGQLRSIRAVQLHLYDGDYYTTDSIDRYFRYEIQSSVDGTTYTQLVDHSTGEHRGLQRMDFAVTPMRYVRIRAISASVGNALVLEDEILVLGDDRVTPHQSQTIVVDGRANSGSSYTNGTQLELHAGIYTIAYVSGAISAFASDSANSGRTWEGHVAVSVPLNNKSYDFGFTHDTISRYATPALVATAFQGRSFTIYLPARTNVYFWFPDGSPGDNRGTSTWRVTQLSGPNDGLLARVRDGMTRSILWQQSAVSAWSSWIYPARSCFGCHIQTQATKGLNESQAKLPDLPVDPALQDQFSQAYQAWQYGNGSAGNSSDSKTQTSLWDWAVSSFRGPRFAELTPNLLQGLNWIVDHQEASGGWSQDDRDTLLWNDGVPSAAHTTSNIQSFARAIEELDTGTFQPLQGVTISGNDIRLSRNYVNRHEVHVTPVEDVTGVKITITGTFTGSNFVLNELDLFDSSARLPIQSATANFEQANFPVSESFNGIRNDINDGWAYYPRDVRAQPAVGFWKLGAAGRLSRLVLTQIYPGHQLSHYRLEYTTDPDPSASSTFLPLQVTEVGENFSDQGGTTQRFKNSLTAAARLFASSGWQFRRNTMTTANTVMGLYDALPYLTGDDAAAARARMQEAGAYLRSIQRPDGGWCYAASTSCPSRTFPSAEAMRALLLLADTELDEALTRGAEHLLTTQDVDGAWTSRGISTRLAVTTWVEIALPTLFDRLNQQFERSVIDDLTTINGLHSVELMWTPIPAARSYNIYRRTADTTFQLIRSGVVSDLATYTDTELPNEVTFYYMVRWVGDDGAESADSNEASGTPFGLECGSDTPPSILSRPVTGATEELLYRYQVDASDPDPGEVLTYSIAAGPPGLTIDGRSGLASWTPTPSDVGSHFVRIVVTDRIGRIATQAYRLNVARVFFNRAPQFVTAPVTNATAGYRYVYPSRALDANVGDILSYLLTVKPDGMSVNSTTGRVTWTPLTSQLGGHDVDIQVRDAGGLMDHQPYQVQVSQNQPPVFNSTPPPTARRERVYIYNVDASDPEQGPIVFSLLSAPSGMSINSATGRILWTPTDAQVGDHTVNIQAADQGGLSATQPYVLNVPPNDPPFISSHPVLTGRVGRSYVYQVVATDPEGGALTYALTTAPTGMSISSSGRITWTPSAAGDSGVTVEVRDPQGLPSTQPFTITVTTGSTGGGGGGDDGPPEVTLTSPTPGALIQTPTEFVGSITDPRTNPTVPLSWTAELRRSGDTTGFPVGHGTGPVDNSRIGSIDPTLLTSDAYNLWVDVTMNGTVFSFYFPYDIRSNLQLGEFTIATTDLTVPVSGFPIDITRQYRSFDTQTGEFGHGWRLRLPGKVVDSASEDPLEAFSSRTRVFVTRPDGKRVGFTFSPYLLSPLLPIWAPAFRADPGVLDTLEVDADALFATPGGFYSFFGEYNPSHYILTTKDRIRYSIDEGQGLLEVRDANRNTLTFSENSIASSTGIVIRVARDSAHRITQITDPQGGLLRYAYSAAGDLLSFTNQLNQVWSYSYDANHRLLTITDPQGHVVLTNVYAADGRLVRQLDGEGHEVQIGISTSTNSETVRDRRGFVSSFHYDDNGNLLSKTDPLGGVTSFTYDANYNLTSETDPLGHITSYTFDGSGNQLTKTDPLGNVTRFTYNALGQKTSETNALGITKRFEYDGLGNLTREIDFSGHARLSAYDGAGNLTAYTDALGHTARYDIDSAGRIRASTDPLGVVSRSTYDAAGNLTEQRKTRSLPGGGTEDVVTAIQYDAANQATRVTDAASNHATIEYDAMGHQTRMVDRRGLEKRFEYDTQGRQTRVTYGDSTSDQFFYDPEGNLIRRVNRLGVETTYEYDALGRQVAVHYADGTTTRSEYDGAGRITAAVDGRGFRTTFDYDAAGREVRRVDPLGHETRKVYDAAGNTTEEYDELGLVTRYEYDPEGRVTRTLFPDGSSTRSEYDAEGKETAKIDEAGNRTEYRYDAAGHLTQVVDALGHTTSYSYDELGNKLTQTDANSHTTRFEYDALGKLRKKILPLGMFERYAYDPNGNKTSRTDFNGVTTTYEYDSNNILNRIRYPDSSSVSIVTRPDGQRSQVTDTRGRTNYEYDSRGRLTRINYPDGTFIRYGYDADGNRTFLETPDGITNFGFDGIGELSSVARASFGTTRYGYTARRELARIEYPNGLVTTQAFDARGRISNIETRNGGTLLQSFGYAVDPLGNRLSIIEESGRTSTYRYDALSRLLREDVSDPANGNSFEAFTYDNTGNRLTRSDSSGTINYSYDDNDRMLTAGASSFTYDNNGNTLTETTGGATKRYTWDFEDRLVGFSQGPSTSSYGYDVDGIRVGSTVNGQSTRFLIDPKMPFQQVLEERDGTGAVQAKYLYGERLVSQQVGAATSYFHADALGSTRAFSGATPALSDRLAYKAFGELAQRSGRTNSKYLFAGEQFDTDNQAYYLRARFYRSSQGRFLSTDKARTGVRELGRLNPYPYVANRPTVLSDRSGNDFIENAILRGAVAGALIGGGISGLRQYDRTGRVDVGLAFQSALSGALAGAVGALGGSYLLFGDNFLIGAGSTLAADLCTLGQVDVAAAIAAGLTLNLNGSEVARFVFGDGISQDIGIGILAIFLGEAGTRAAPRAVQAVNEAFNRLLQYYNVRC